MSDQTNKEILEELKKLNEKVDTLANPQKTPLSTVIVNCILIFFTAMAAASLFIIIPLFF